MSLMDRERDFEARYAHDQELRFRIEARKNKLVGLWAAEKLGKNGDDASLYAQDVIKVVFVSPSVSNVFDKIRRDFDAAGVDQSDREIQRTIAAMLLDAEAQINRE